MSVKAWQEDVIIPTYEIGKAEKNPIFLEKRVYQGSSGVVYPHAVVEKIEIKFGYLIKALNFALPNKKGVVLLKIKDNGIGFDTQLSSKGVGLLNIKARAALFNGEMEIISSPGKGCELIIKFSKY